MTEQTELDPYSIALRRLESVLDVRNRKVEITRFPSGQVFCEISDRSGETVYVSRDSLPASINAACDAVEGV